MKRVCGDGEWERPTLTSLTRGAFGLIVPKVGIIGECGVVHRAIRQFPHRIAMALILTGERIKADQVMRYGLVKEVVPFAALQEAAQSWGASYLPHRLSQSKLPRARYSRGATCR